MIISMGIRMNTRINDFNSVYLGLINYIINHDIEWDFETLLSFIDRSICSLINENTDQAKCTRGELAELAVFYILRQYNIAYNMGGYILQNMILAKDCGKYGKSSNEIDTCFITRHCIYPIEVKCWAGNLLVDSNYITHGKFQSNVFGQNKSHCETIKQILIKERLLNNGYQTYAHNSYNYNELNNKANNSDLYDSVIIPVIWLYNPLSTLFDNRQLNERIIKPVLFNKNTFNLFQYYEQINSYHNLPVLNIANILTVNDIGYTQNQRECHIGRVRSKVRK